MAWHREKSPARQCVICGEEFPARNFAKTCSLECSRELWLVQRRKYYAANSAKILAQGAGRGQSAIVRVLRNHNHNVTASDIHDYGGLDFVGDFLAQEQMPTGCEAIVTNPPFKFVEPFVSRALELAPLAIMLLRLAFLESERRCHILEACGLARVHVFRKRLPMMHRDGWEGRKSNSGMAFAWFVWIRHYIGPTLVDRISWER